MWDFLLIRPAQELERAIDIFTTFAKDLMEDDAMLVMMIGAFTNTWVEKLIHHELVEENDENNIEIEATY